MEFSEIISIDRSDVHAKRQGQGNRGQNKFCPNLGILGLWLQFEFTNGYGMMHKAWTGTEEVPNWFSMSSIKFQGHTDWANHRAVWSQLKMDVINKIQ